MDEFPANLPGNSHAAKIAAASGSKESSESKPKTGSEKLETVVTGKVTKRKKKLGTRVKEHFLSEGEGFVDRLVQRLIPKAEDIFNSIIDDVANSVKDGVGEAIFPGRTRSTSHRVATRINYNNVSRSTIRPSGMPQRYNAVVRRSNVIEEFEMELRADAELVLDTLLGVIERQGHCTVGDLYDLVGITPRSTDEEWGWSDLTRARVVTIQGGGFTISFPRPMSIDNGL